MPSNPIPLKGDRSAWAVTENKQLHTDEVEDSGYKIHVPEPSTSDETLVSDANNEWTAIKIGLFLSKLSVVSVAANYTVRDGTSENVILVDTTGGAVTITLPSPSSDPGCVYVKYAAGSNNVTIDTAASESIDGGASYTLTSLYESVALISDGDDWFVIASA